MKIKSQENVLKVLNYMWESIALKMIGKKKKKNNRAEQAAGRP